MTKLSRHLIEELLFYNILAKSCAERLECIYLQIAVSNGPSFQVLNYVIKIVPQLRTAIPIGICMLVQLNVIAYVLLKASAVTILPLSGTLIFNLNNEL